MAPKRKQSTASLGDDDAKRKIAKPGEGAEEEAAAAKASMVSGEALPDDVRKRIEANKLAALEKKKQRQGVASTSAGVSSLEEEKRLLIEANRESALEKKRQKKEEAVAAERVGSIPTPMQQPPPSQHKVAPPPDGFEEEEDEVPAHYPKNTVPIREHSIEWLPEGWTLAYLIHEAGNKRRCFISPAPEGKIFWTRQHIEKHTGKELPLESGQPKEPKQKEKKEAAAEVKPAENKPSAPGGLVVDFDSFALNADATQSTTSLQIAQANSTVGKTNANAEKQPVASTAAASGPMKSAKTDSKQQSLKAAIAAPAPDVMQQPTPARPSVRLMKKSPSDAGKAPTDFAQALSSLDCLGFVGTGAKQLPEVV